MKLAIDTTSADSYRLFLKIKQLPKFRFVGRTAVFPDEYAERLGLQPPPPPPIDFDPIPGLFDYQRDIARTALEKGKFAVFADCGLGKTLIFLEFARHIMPTLDPNGIILIVSPLMVVSQTIDEADDWYGGSLEIEHVVARDLASRMNEDRGGIVITNYDALSERVEQGNVKALILDESSMLKSHYGKWASHCLRIGAGLKWKLACTGTPAPNDRIEYANHAVFLDAFPTVNSFLAKFFVNKGQTQERWILKPHALEPFYRTLSHWSIFLTNPAVYGWKDGCGDIPPIHVHVHDVALTEDQQDLVFEKTGTLFASEIGGITSRSVLSQIAKGNHRGEKIPTNKPASIRTLVESWPDESTLVWCRFNAEQERLEQELPEAASLKGATPPDERQRIVDDFKAGRIRTLISKPKILGFGLNLQVATRQIFSGLQDSYEEFYQAVKRSNRIGSTRPLNVHIPVTDIERPMIDTVLRKSRMVQRDTEEQERIFRKASSHVVT